jgi:hypothetical protein
MRDRHGATLTNNDADAGASQDPQDGKGQKLLPQCNRVVRYSSADKSRG